MKNVSFDDTPQTMYLVVTIGGNYHGNQKMSVIADENGQKT
jgi:hypothetical protein